VRSFIFEVPEGFAALRLAFSYGPRACRDQQHNSSLIDAALRTQADEARAMGLDRLPDLPGARSPDPLLSLRKTLRNLLNLTMLDGEGRPRGRWDRNTILQQGEDDLICEAWASPGFIAGVIVPGPWTVTLEVHEVISPRVEYRLRIEGLQHAPAPPARRALAGRRRSPRVSQEFPEPSPGGWLRGEIHTHTTASDGLYEPAQLVERAQELGLEFLAITDHNSTTALESVKHAPLPILPGCEITTFFGHFLVYGISAAPPWYEDDVLIPPRQLQRRLPQRHRPLFSLGHPFVLGNPICCGCRLDAPFDAEKVDLVEVWTRGHSDPLADAQALMLFDKLRADGHPVVAVCGRDWHGPAQESAVTCRRYPALMVRAEPRPGAILNALQRGAAYLSTGPFVDFSLIHPDGRTTLGQRLPDGAAMAGDLEAEVSLQELSGPALLKLVDNGRVVLERTVGPGKGAALRHPVTALGGGVRAELWSRGGSPLLLTNAIGS